MLELGGGSGAPWGIGSSGVVFCIMSAGGETSGDTNQYRFSIDHNTGYASLGGFGSSYPLDIVSAWTSGGDAMVRLSNTNSSSGSGTGIDFTVAGNSAATGKVIHSYNGTGYDTYLMNSSGGAPVSALKIVGNNSNAIEIAGNIELGNATDTTIARVSAGVISVEGVTVPTISSTSTITNKRNEPRTVSATSYTTNTGTSLTVATTDVFVITAQAGALKFNNPGGTPVNGEKLIIRIKDDGTARALTYDTQFRASSDLALPTTTILSKTLYMGFIFNSTDTTWDLLAVLNNF